MASSQSPTDSTPTSNYEHFINQTTGQLFRKQHGKGPLHLVHDGDALCGNKAWFICGPAALFADELPHNICKNCLRVQGARKYTPKQLGFDFGEAVVSDA